MAVSDSTKYSPSRAPRDINELASYVERELNTLSRTLQQAGILKVAELNAEPSKPRTGDLALADGTNWDPGNGRALYIYIGNTWTQCSIGANQLTLAMFPDDLVTYAKIQNVSATDRLLGRSSAGAGDIEEIVCTSAGRALLDDASAADQRDTLGLGTAAVKDTGTSGDAVPLLDGDNTWSGTNEWGAYSNQGASTGKAIQPNHTLGPGRLASSVDSTTGRQHQVFVNPNGQVGSISTNGSNTSFNTSSDGQLKTNRVPLEEEVDLDQLFDTLVPKAFDWLDTAGNETGVRGHGLVAQEVYELVPQAVTPGHGSPGDEDYEPWAIDYAKLVPYLWAEVRALRARVAQLEGT